VSSKNKLRKLEREIGERKMHTKEYANLLLDNASDLSTSDSKTFSWISANFSMTFACEAFNFPKLVD